MARNQLNTRLVPRGAGMVGYFLRCSRGRLQLAADLVHITGHDRYECIKPPLLPAAHDAKNIYCNLSTCMRKQRILINHVLRPPGHKNHPNPNLNCDIYLFFNFLKIVVNPLQNNYFGDQSKIKNSAHVKKEGKP